MRKVPDYNEVFLEIRVHLLLTNKLSKRGHCGCSGRHTVQTPGLPSGEMVSGGSLHLAVRARPCLDMIAAMLKSVAHGLIVQLSSMVRHRHRRARHILSQPKATHQESVVDRHSGASSRASTVISSFH